MAILKKRLLSFLLPVLFLLAAGQHSFAQTTYDWTGAVNTDWTTAGNWNVGGSTASTYPGLNSTDIVRIGVIGFYTGSASTTHDPIVSSASTINIASLTFGDNGWVYSATVQPGLNPSSPQAVQLVVNGTLNVSGTILQMHSTQGPTGVGNTSPYYTYSIYTSVQGTGSVTCAALTVGDNTAPTNTGVIGVTKFRIGVNTGTSANMTFTVTGDATVYTYIWGDGTTNNNIISENCAELSLGGGTTNIYGKINVVESTTKFKIPTPAASNGQYIPLAFFSLDLFKNAYGPTLNLYATSPVNIQTGNVRNNIDFYNIYQSGGTGQCTVNYAASGAQNIVTYKAGGAYNNFIDNAFQPNSGVSTIGTPAGGSGYVNGTYYDVPLTGSATGVGAMANITVSGGSVTSVTIQPTFVGNNYLVGDVLTASNTNLGGTGSGFSVTVASVTSTSSPPNISAVYQNVSFSGSGTKTADVSGGTFSVGGNFTLATGTETVDISTNSPVLTIGGNFSSASGTILNKAGSASLTINGTTSNGGTFNHSGSAAITFDGVFTNSGTYNQSGTSTVTTMSAATNSGTYTQSGSGALNITNIFTNSGTSSLFSQTGAATANFTGAVSNGGQFNQNNSSAFLNFNNTYTSTTGSTFTLTSGTTTFNNSYTNAGTFKQTGGTAYINQSGAQSLADNSANGTTFSNVYFQNGGTKMMSGSGQFYISGLGLMNLVNNTTVAANGILTILSDATGSGTVAAIPSGCSVTGNVTVQRYIPGGTPSARGYRLLSPSTYAATDAANNNIYSISYLLNSTYISGTAFPSTASNPNSKTGNPSLYIYRENLVPSNASFLTSNYRGIESLASDPYYLINIDSDNGGPQFDIPVGNGFLFFFRGGLGTTNPFSTGNTPLSGTLATTGTLNQGTVSVNNWWNVSQNTTGLLYSTVSGDLSIEGTNLVGNPFPATLDWTKFSATDNTAAIYGPGLTGAIWMLVPGTQAGAGNYASYLNGLATNGGTSVIASGEGFFVQATGTGATLTFNENAKTNTQATGAAVFMANRQTLSATVNQQIRLQLQLDTISTDEILINFNPNTKPGYNMLEDVRYRIGSGKVNLAALSSDNVALAINQLPLATKGDTIKLKVGATASGTYTLKAEAITGIPQLFDIWLKDAFTKDSVNLRTTSTYSFTITTTDTTTFGANRFKLVLQQDPAMAYQLLSFDAEKTSNGQDAQLTWKTKNEENYTNFTVERSNDNGKTYNVIGSVSSNGGGAYSLIDHNPDKGDNLYRLKQVDFNNNITYSNTVDVHFDNNVNVTRLNLYPNPAINNIFLSFYPRSQGKTTYNIRITNSTGMVVRFAQITDTSWHDNISNLLTGTYLVQVTDKKDNSIVGQTKFVKL